MSERFKKVRLCLKSVMKGIPIEIGGCTYAMSDDGDLCILMKTNGEESYYPLHVSLSSFVELCDNTTNAESMVIAANIVLTDM